MSRGHALAKISIPTLDTLGRHSMTASHRSGRGFRVALVGKVASDGHIYQSKDLLGGLELKGSSRRMFTPSEEGKGPSSDASASLS